MSLFNVLAHFSHLHCPRCERLRSLTVDVSSPQVFHLSVMRAIAHHVNANHSECMLDDLASGWSYTVRLYWDGFDANSYTTGLDLSSLAVPDLNANFFLVQCRGFRDHIRLIYQQNSR